MRNIKITVFIGFFLLALNSCTESDDVAPVLDIPTEFVSASFDANVTSETSVVGDLSTMTSALNDAESNAQNTAVSAIEYPSDLKSVTIDSYSSRIDSWLVELVSASNSIDGFQTPIAGQMPIPGQEGGLLGSRLLDEYGLELEQMIQKGSFGAALYNHASSIVANIKSGANDLDSKEIDRLVAVHGTRPAFDETTAAATYSARRSNHTTKTGFFYDIKTNLITAKAAMEAGSVFNSRRDAALDDYLLNWEKSNFATVIYYANNAKGKLQTAFTLEDGDDKNAALGNALHSYAEGVAFIQGFRGLSNKQITDAQIDSISTLLRASFGQNPESYLFVIEGSAELSRLDDVINEIQTIYGFTNEEVASFYTSNNL